jgi:hypothetical protein
MSNQRFASVWDALEDTPEEAENMKLLSSLRMALQNHIAHSGMSQAQAAKLATKRDLKELEAKMDARFAEVKTDMQNLEYRLVIRLGTMVVAAVAVVAALVKLL